MYSNQFASGYEVMRKSSSYNIGSHGDLSATATHLITNDFPSYAGMFYHPSEHEVISSIKYKQENPGYDLGLREIQESMQGKPLEFYIPQSISAADGIGKGNIEIVNPFREVSDKINKGIIHEIQKAQDQVRGRTLVYKELEIEETLILRRRIKKKEVHIKKG